MLGFLSSPYFLLFARLCVGGVLLASALGKLADREGTAEAMQRYPFLPGSLGRLAAYILPYIELAVGVLLLVGLFTRVAAFAAALMLTLFTALVIYDLSRKQQQSCHCFGRISSEKLTVVAPIRNVVLLLLALLVAGYFDGWVALDNLLPGNMLGAFGLVAQAPTAVVHIADAIIISMLSLAAVLAIVFGEQAVSTVRGTLRGLGFR